MTEETASEDYYRTPGIAGGYRIYPPKDGWKPSTYYIVEVAYHEYNPIHKSILYTGFLNDAGVPDSYNGIFVQGDVENRFRDLYYIRAVAELKMAIHEKVKPSMEIL